MVPVAGCRINSGGCCGCGGCGGGVIVRGSPSRRRATEGPGNRGMRTKLWGIVAVTVICSYWRRIVRIVGSRVGIVWCIGVIVMVWIVMVT